MSEVVSSPRPKRAARVDDAKAYADSTLRILHFNDVYNVEGFANEPKGGAARFRTMLDQHRDDDALVLFSGDAFAPSVVSTVLKGAQMPSILDCLRVDVAMIGNHDLDFGVDRCVELTGQTHFPWLLTNARLKADPDFQLAHAKRIHVVERRGRNVGFVGLIEADWLATLATLTVDDVLYEDFSECAIRTATELRDQHGCDCVIALTHMRKPNDAKLARDAGHCLDLILGGHDHHYEVFTENETLVCKSGTDFKDATDLTLQFLPDEESDGRPDDDENGRHPRRRRKKTKITSHERVLVDGSVEEDPEVLALVEKFASQVETSLHEAIGETAVPLDARFAAVRSSETNLSNFVADVARRAANADVVMINSGTLRTDAVVPVGTFTKRDLVTLLPMADDICVVSMPGTTLLAALENGVSQWPKLEGRFPAVSGVRFAFDASRAPGSRVESVTVDGQPLVDDQTYTVAIKQYMRTGKDGYDMFPACPVLVEDALPALQAMVANHFESRHVLHHDAAAPNGPTVSFEPIAPVRDGRIALVGGCDPVVQPADVLN